MPCAAAAEATSQRWMTTTSAAMAHHHLTLQRWQCGRLPRRCVAPGVLMQQRRQLLLLELLLLQHHHAPPGSLELLLPTVRRRPHPLNALQTHSQQPTLVMVWSGAALVECGPLCGMQC